MAKSTKLSKIKDINCLNCGFPFQGYESFCPECGQANKGDKLTFGSFIKEVFNGFFSWEAKFWKTIIPLLISPGKVSKDYIGGKRMRFANPFRFYLAVSVLFFLIFGLVQSYDKFKGLNSTSKKEKDSVKIVDSIVKKELNNINLDSIRTQVNKDLKKAYIPKIARDKIIEEIEKNAKEVPKKKQKSKISFDGETRLDKFVNFFADNPNVSADEALDSLGYEKNFKNRFLYDRAKVSSSFTKEESFEKFGNEILSNATLSIFILLPIFTLFLKFYYIRTKYTYVDHLVFVFHTQTVFFLLLTIFVILNFITKVKPIIIILLFLVYLFLAMKKFYNQGYLKTFIKFCLVNFTYFIILVLGAITSAFISFAFYQG